MHRLTKEDNSMNAFKGLVYALKLMAAVATLGALLVMLGYEINEGLKIADCVYAQETLQTITRNKLLYQDVDAWYAAMQPHMNFINEQCK